MGDFGKDWGLSGEILIFWQTDFDLLPTQTPPDRQNSTFFTTSSRDHP
jgi:hypothetical protein